MTMRRLFAITALAAVGVGLTACGGEDDSLGSSPDETSGAETGGGGDTRQRLRIAEEKTSEQQSVGVDITMNLDVDGQGFSMDMNGVSDFATGAADFALDVSGSGLDADLRMITDATTVWVTEDDETWYSIPVDEFESGSATPPGLDATGYLAFLEQMGDVTSSGEEEMDGVSTTHYRAEVDLADFAEAQGTAVDADALEQAGIESLPIDVWIDGDDLVRRVAITMDANVEGTSFAMDIEADFSDFDSGATIATPPAGDIQPGSSSTLEDLMTG